MAGRNLRNNSEELFDFYEFHEWRNSIAVLRGAYVLKEQSLRSPSNKRGVRNRRGAEWDGGLQRL